MGSLLFVIEIWCGENWAQETDLVQTRRFSKLSASALRRVSAVPPPYVQQRRTSADDVLHHCESTQQASSNRSIQHTLHSAQPLHYYYICCSGYTHVLIIGINDLQAAASAMGRYAAAAAAGLSNYVDPISPDLLFDSLGSTFAPMVQVRDWRVSLFGRVRMSNMCNVMPLLLETKFDTHIIH